MENQTKMTEEDSPSAKFVRVMLRSCNGEVSTPLRGQTAGEVPRWLRGSLLRNGPGLRRIGPDQYDHMFDGMALLQRFCVSDGVVTYQNKFLRSAAYEKNTRANRIVVTEFCTIGHPDPCASIFDRISSLFYPDLTDNAAISVMPIGDEYYAMTEAPHMHRIDPTTLDTLNHIDLRDVVAVNSATAHPHIDAVDGGTFNMGSSRAGYVIVKFPAGESAIEQGRVAATVPAQNRFHPSYVHSFALTEHYLVFLEQSLTINVVRFLTASFRRIPYVQCLDFDPTELVRFRVVDKATGELLKTQYLSDSFLVFHHINAFEKEGHIVVDLCAFKDDEVIRVLYTAAKSRAVPGGTPRRYVLPLNPDITSKAPGTNVVALTSTTATATLKEGGIWLQHEDLRPVDSLLSFELPRINYTTNGKPYQFVYAVGDDVAISGSFLVKLDIRRKTWTPYVKKGWIPSEPVFVPRPGVSAEDDGVILSAFLNTEDERKVALLILDGRSFKEVAWTEFVSPSVVPSSFHGWFGEVTDKE